MQGSDVHLVPQQLVAVHDLLRPALGRAEHRVGVGEELLLPAISVRSKRHLPLRATEGGDLDSGHQILPQVDGGLTVHGLGRCARAPASHPAGNRLRQMWCDVSLQR